MDNKINQINHNIRKGKLLEENIPKFFNYLADRYYSYSGIQLAMNYYSFYESYYDEENTWSKDFKGLVTKINTIIRDNVLQNRIGIEREEAISAIDAIRNEIMKRMNALTAYTDIFQIYEYVLNRLEYRFKDNLEQVDEEELSREILRYIFDTEDNFIINEKIKDIIGQLPMRITKQKFFELLSDSILAYLGAGQFSFEGYLYTLRTSAMLYHQEDMDTLYPFLWEKKEYLSHLEYKEITKEAFDKALSTLQAATLILETETTVYYYLQELVNAVYSLLLCSVYEGMVTTEVEAAEKAAFFVINEINNYFFSEEKKELPEELVEKFTDIEGVQEDLAYEVSNLEDVLFEINLHQKALTENLMLDQLLEVLLYTNKLNSSSLFIDLDENISKEEVNEVQIKAASEALEKELTELFAGQDRIITRAVMANTLNKIPVFFKDHKEVMDYVLYSLERCSDVYEKAACAEIINEMIED